MELFDNTYRHKNNNIALIDGSNFFYRSALVTYKDTKMDFGIRLSNFFKMFGKATKDRPKYCAIVFDSGKPNFRHKLYPQYKANRNKHGIEDGELLLKVIKKILKYSGFTVLYSDNYEADDIIGALSKFATPTNKVVIYSEDKDFLQLVNDNVFVVKNNIIFDSAIVQKKFGIEPSQFAEYLALIGDSSDNIPGIKLWGKKTASEYLNEHGNIATIQQLQLKKSLRGILDYDTVALYKKLVSIKTNINVIQDIEQLSIKKRDFEALTKLSRDYKIHIGNIGL